jgi:hypothetical protein
MKIIKVYFNSYKRKNIQLKISYLKKKELFKNNNKEKQATKNTY